MEKIPPALRGYTKISDNSKKMREGASPLDKRGRSPLKGAVKKGASEEEIQAQKEKNKKKQEEKKKKQEAKNKQLKDKENKAYQEYMDGRTKIEKKHNIDEYKPQHTTKEQGFKGQKWDREGSGYVAPPKEEPYKEMADKWANKYPKDGETGGGEPQANEGPSAAERMRDMKSGKGQPQPPGPGQDPTTNTGVNDPTPPTPPPTGGNTPPPSPPPPQYQGYYDPTTGTMKYSPISKKFKGGKKNTFSKQRKQFKAIDR